MSPNPANEPDMSPGWRAMGSPLKSGLLASFHSMMDLGDRGGLLGEAPV